MSWSQILLRWAHNRFCWYSFSCEKQLQKASHVKNNISETGRVSTWALFVSPLTLWTSISLFSYLLHIDIYVTFATFYVIKINQNRMWSQEYMTVIYLWEDYDMFSTKIGIYFWQKVVYDCFHKFQRQI